MLRTTNDLIDCAISATDGHIGRVKDCYVHDEPWFVRYLVVDTGRWLSSRKVLIPNFENPEFRVVASPSSATRHGNMGKSVNAFPLRIAGDIPARLEWGAKTSRIGMCYAD